MDGRVHISTIASIPSATTTKDGRPIGLIDAETDGEKR